MLQGEKESHGLETLPQTADPKEGHDEDDGAEHGSEVRRGGLPERHRNNVAVVFAPCHVAEVVGLAEGPEEDAHQFSNGDVVGLFRAEPAEDRVFGEGVREHRGARLALAEPLRRRSKRWLISPSLRPTLPQGRSLDRYSHGGVEQLRASESFDQGSLEMSSSLAGDRSSREIDEIRGFAPAATGRSSRKHVSSAAPVSAGFEAALLA